MYLLIFPDFSGCASSSISVQIHDGAYSSIFVRYHQISSLIRPQVLSVLSRFCPFSGIFRKYVFVHFFNALSRIPLCSFNKLFLRRMVISLCTYYKIQMCKTFVRWDTIAFYVPRVQTFAHLFSRLTPGTNCFRHQVVPASDVSSASYQMS